MRSGFLTPVNLARWAPVELIFPGRQLNMDKLRIAGHRAACSSGLCSDQRTEVECEDCGLDPICMVLDYAEAESGVPEGVLVRRRPIERGETLFHKGDPFHSLYAVKSGSFKTLIPRDDRPDQVIGFHLPGELIGAEAMAGESYPCTARALEKSSVCELRLDRLPDAGRPLEALQRSIIELLGKEVAFSHELIGSLVHQSAEQRVAGFLLSLSERLQRRGMPSADFTLSMSRSDIGNYLGLASETVSRIFTRFQKQDLIRIQRKHIFMKDLRGLVKVSGV